MDDDFDYFQDDKDNYGKNYQYQNLNDNGKNYNNFGNNVNYGNNVNDKEKERMKKINDNFNLIMSNTDKDNFMAVKKVNFSNI